MIIDTTDPETLAQLNTVERQTLRRLADRLSLLAWRKVHSGMAEGLPTRGEPGTPLGAEAVEPPM